MKLIYLLFLTCYLTYNVNGQQVGSSGHINSTEIILREKPKGSYIASKSSKVKLDHANMVTATILNKKVTFTPAFFVTDSLGNGKIMGVLETEIAGDETNLPPGKYNIYVANVKGKLHCYAESNGKIIKEAARVELVDTQLKERAEIFPKGWGISISCKGGHWYWPKHCTIKAWW